jgi:hypothetical protein
VWELFETDKVFRFEKPNRNSKWRVQCGLRLSTRTATVNEDERGQSMASSNTITTRVIASSRSNHRNSSSTLPAGTMVIGQHYRVGKKIGEGNFGVVFEGVNILKSAPVAIKFVSNEDFALCTHDL